MLQSTGREYVVYSEVEGEPACDTGGAVSTFTFLNFLASSLSLAANLGSNSNSNNNNNNDNNNDNNNNDNNINIGNNNNNVNSGNTIMFLPMIGKRSTLGEHPFSTTIEEICSRQAEGHSDLALVGISAIQIFTRLTQCSHKIGIGRRREEGCQENICSLVSSLKPANQHLQPLFRHLAKGAVMLALGQELPLCELN